jgi:hypothetical protein
LFTPDGNGGTRGNFTFDLVLGGVPKARLESSVDSGSSSNGVELQLIQRALSELKKNLGSWAESIPSQSDGGSGAQGEPMSKEIPDLPDFDDDDDV